MQANVNHRRKIKSVLSLIATVLHEFDITVVDILLKTTHAIKEGNGSDDGDNVNDIMVEYNEVLYKFSIH